MHMHMHLSVVTLEGRDDIREFQWRGHLRVPSGRGRVRTGITRQNLVSKLDADI